METIVILTDQFHKTGKIDSPFLLDNRWANKKEDEVHVATTGKVKNPAFYDLGPKSWFNELIINYNPYKVILVKKIQKWSKISGHFKNGKIGILC